MMERAVECATHNLGRIRLVWGRLWGVLSAHLVSAACHPDIRVATAAVDHMHLLATTLLARAQLSGFSYQVCTPGRPLLFPLVVSFPTGPVIRVLHIRVPGVTMGFS